jgi:O-antigen ligase
LGNDLLALTQAAKLKSTSHNDYLLVLVETGCIGLSLYLFLLWSLFRRTLQSIRQAGDEETRLLCVSALAMLVAFLVGSIGEHLLQTPGATGYVLTVLGMAHGTLLAPPGTALAERQAGTQRRYPLAQRCSALPVAAKPLLSRQRLSGPTE